MVCPTPEAMNKEKKQRGSENNMKLTIGMDWDYRYYLDHRESIVFGSWHGVDYIPLQLYLLFSEAVFFTSVRRREVKG